VDKEFWVRVFNGIVSALGRIDFRPVSIALESRLVTSDK